MKTIFRDTSISARLTRMNLLVSGSVLLLAGLAFFSYDLISFRQALIRNLDAEARIVGANSVSALLFNDPQSAAKTLEALRSSPDILAAAILTNQGEVFARYQRPGVVKPLLTLPLAPGTKLAHWTSGAQTTLAYRIVFQGKPVGVVYISARLAEIGERALNYLLIGSIIFILCMGAVLLISSIFRRLVAQPIVRLAETAHLVSREKDYSMRAEAAPGHSETSVLVDAFNEMLAQIQSRDTALLQAHTQLEQRVQERTSELKLANRELEAFSYTVAHDLRAPLETINGLTYILQHAYQGSLDGEGGQMLSQLRDCSENMGRLIDDLLNLSRATTSPLERTTVDLSRIARSIADNLKLGDPARDVEVVIAAAVSVHADAGLMRVAMDNLLRNAWKYTSRHKKARIEFGWLDPNGQIVYFVRDDGAGFDPNQIERLFQPFQRLHTTGEFPGTGIGLATVQRIFARHNGKIWAEGSIEQGATFYFTL